MTAPGSAVRFRCESVPEGTDDDLFEALAGIPCSWTATAAGVTVWAAEEDAGAARQALDAAGLAIASEDVEPPRDWVAASADLRIAVAVGGYLLDPHQGARATEPGPRRRLHIPATRAFGTGSHESTRLALRLLQELPLEGCRVLDVGCGAGTLAFVAALEGAADVVAFDLDPDAAYATAALARENGIARVRVLAGPLEALALTACFDVIAANLLQEEVAPLLAGIAARLVPGGLLVTSGQLAAREGEWRSLLQVHRFTPERVETENEWLATISRAVAGDLAEAISAVPPAPPCGP